MSFKIFFSYNPNIEKEQKTVNRIQVLGDVYNISVFLPDRFGTEPLKRSTEHRIKEADCYLLFSMGDFSNTVRDEIIYANSLSKPVIVLLRDYIPEVVEKLEFLGVKVIKFRNLSPGDYSSVLLEIESYLKNKKTNLKDRITVSGIVSLANSLFYLWKLKHKDEPDIIGGTMKIYNEIKIEEIKGRATCVWCGLDSAKILNEEEIRFFNIKSFFHDSEDVCLRCLVAERPLVLEDGDMRLLKETDAENIK